MTPITMRIILLTLLCLRKIILPQQEHCSQSVRSWKNQQAQNRHYIQSGGACLLAISCWKQVNNIIKNLLIYSLLDAKKFFLFCDTITEKNFVTTAKSTAKVDPKMPVLKEFGFNKLGAATFRPSLCEEDFKIEMTSQPECIMNKQLMYHSSKLQL